MKILFKVALCICTLFGISPGVPFGRCSDSVQAGLPCNVIKKPFATISEWLTIGPLRVDNVENDGLFTLCGSRESDIDLPFISRILREGILRRTKATVPGIGRVSGDIGVDFLAEYQLKFSYKTEPRIAYALCEIESDDSGVYYILSGSDDTMKLWINGVCLIDSRIGRPMKGYSEITPVYLRKGKNLCVAKVGNFSGGWTFQIGCAASVEAALSSFIDSGGMRIKKFVYKSMEFPELECSLPGEATRAFLTIREMCDISEGGKLTERPRMLDGGEEHMPREGLFTIEVAAGGGKYREQILFGDVQRYLPRIRRFLTTEAMSENVRDSLETVLRRLAVLVNVENCREDDVNWQHKAVTLLANAAHIMKLSLGAERAFRGASGLHFGAFRSKIDGSVQNYRVYVPTTYTHGNPIGVVVVLPTNVLRSSPYIESALVADEMEALAFADAAERAGVAIVWSGYRCRPYGNPCDFVHFDEVMDDLGKDYMLDLRRVSLLGTCSSGTLASMFVVRWPERFAAVGMVNPFLHRTQNRWDERFEFRDLNAYKKWIAVNDPLPAVAKVGGVHFRIIQNIDDPDHGPYWQTKELIEAARASGNGKSFQMQEMFFSSENMQSIWQKLLIPWLAQEERATVSARCAIAEIERRTISNALSEPFVVVIGTSGSIQENIENRKIAYAFQAQWIKTHSVGCRVVEDTALTASELDEWSVVLVGRKSSNAAWDKVVDSDEIIIDENGVRLFGRRIEGSDLGVQALVRNVFNKRRSAIVLAGNSQQAHFGTMDLAIDGWYRCAIWKTRDGAVTLLDAW